jgi:hypothetical protein
MRRTSTGVLVAAALAALYGRYVRPAVLTWGAGRSQAEERLPGDELLEDADGVSTRAVDIAAPPSAVWPWLAQMGPFPRGGAYTYDWIENLLGLRGRVHLRLDREPAGPEHAQHRLCARRVQHPHVGDVIGFGANVMRLERLDSERVLAWRSQDGNWVWTFVLKSENGSTRLIGRNRFRLPTLASQLVMLPMEPAWLVMERKMLAGIKRRAERLASSTRAFSSVG